MPNSPSTFAELEQLTINLHNEVAAGRSSGDAAMDIRDRMDELWDGVSEAEYAELAALSAELAMTHRGEKPRPRPPVPLAAARGTKHRNNARGFTPADARRARTARLVREVKAAFVARRWQDALEGMREEPSAFPPLTRAIVRGRAYYHLGRHRPSLAFHQFVRKLSPRDHDAYLPHLLRNLAEVGLKKEAKRQAEAYLAGWQLSREARASVIAVLVAMAREMPDSPERAARAGQLLPILEAEIRSARIAHDRLTLAVLHYNLGNCRSMTGDEAGAEVELRKSHDLEPHRHAVLLTLGFKLIRREGDESERGAGMVAESIRLGSPNPTAPIILALYHLKADRPKDSYRYANMALDYNLSGPDAAVVYHTRGLARLALSHNVDSVMSDLRQALATSEQPDTIRKLIEEVEGIAAEHGTVPRNRLAELFGEDRGFADIGFDPAGDYGSTAEESRMATLFA